MTHFLNYRSLLFLALLIAYLIPLFQFQYFPTVDGPAHLYNARLIVELLRDPHGFIASFHDLQGLLKPNVLGHLLLAGLLIIAPAFVTEKVVLAIMLLGLPLAGRYVLSAYGAHSKAWSYMLIPFAYSYLFYFGFFNFNLGVILFLVALGTWIRYMRERRARQLWTLAVLSLFTGLAHLFTFGILLISVVILNLNFFLPGGEKSVTLRWNILHQLLVLIPGLAIILISGIGANEVGTDLRWLPITDILISLKYIMPLKGVQFEAYDLISRAYLYLLTLSVIFLFGRWLFDRHHGREQRLQHGPLAYLTLVMLVLVFVLPDHTGSAGVITARMMHVFFILLLLWLGVQRWPQPLKIGMMACAIIIDLLVLNHNVSVARNSDLGDRIAAISSLIRNESLLLPITFSQDPLHKHIANYAGADGRIVVLENYEANLNYFPIKWDIHHFDDLVLGDLKPTECITWPTNGTGERRMIDHVMIIKDLEGSDHNTCHTQLYDNLDKYYTRIDQMHDERIELYRVKITS